MPNLTDQERQDAYNTSADNIVKFSVRISELCKFVWAGALAIFYALVTAEPTSAASKFMAAQRPLLFIAAIAGALAFVFDYLQNITAYIQATRMVQWIEARNQIDVAEYNIRTRDFWARANELFFVIKNLAVLIAAVLVAYVIAMGFLKSV
jgi:hypothetical protein